VTLSEFKRLEPSARGLSIPLKALLLDARGDWEAAHVALQDDDSQAAAWVHAYLHRKEGDAANARYWYNRAARAFPKMPLPAEWEEIATVLLGESEA
jgi:hypothetical protein